MKRLGQKAMRRTSLQMVITIYFMVGMLFLLLIVSTGVITRVSTLLEENAMERTRQTVNQGNASLSIYVNDMLETMDFFANLGFSGFRYRSAGSEKRYQFSAVFPKGRRRHGGIRPAGGDAGKHRRGTVDARGRYPWLQLVSKAASIRQPPWCFSPRPTCRTYSSASMPG